MGSCLPEPLVFGSAKAVSRAGVSDLMAVPGVSEAMAKGIDGANQSAGGSMVVDYVVQPQEFTMLRTGGQESDYSVDAIIFQGGRRWLGKKKGKPEGMNHIRHVFPQIYKPVTPS